MNFSHKRPSDFCFLETLGGPKCNEDVEEGLGVKFSCIICRPEARIERINNYFMIEVLTKYGIRPIRPFIMHENFTPRSSFTFSLHFGPPNHLKKQKSLGLLSKKLMSRFPDSVPDGEKCEIRN